MGYCFLLALDALHGDIGNLHENHTAMRIIPSFGVDEFFEDWTCSLVVHMYYSSLTRQFK